MTNDKLLESLTKRVSADELDASVLNILSVCMVTLSMDDLLTLLRSTAHEVQSETLDWMPDLDVDLDKDDADKIVEKVASTFLKKLYFNQITDKGNELVGFKTFVAGWRNW